MSPAQTHSDGLRRRPLEGLLVLDLAQFLSGPSAALRLADLGARVIKVERPGSGDICRQLYLSDTQIDGDSTLFHAINRNKESFAADLKDPQDLAAVKQLIGRADVLIQNFRPGVIERLGLGYDAVREINPRIVYAGISGYGEDGPWVDLPGQDLLSQAVSGLMWLTGRASDGPVPVGLSIADMLAGHIVVEAVLAALVSRGLTGEGAHVQTSLFEAVIDFQFEVLATYLNDGGRLPERAAAHSAHAYLGAPYGVYRTVDGHLALAMSPAARLAPLLDLPDWEAQGLDPFLQRDEIQRAIAERLCTETTEFWMERLRAEDIWCAPVLNWPQMLEQEAFKRLHMVQKVAGAPSPMLATRSPVRVNGRPLLGAFRAPKVGEHTASIKTEFGVDTQVETTGWNGDARSYRESGSKP